MMVGSSGLESRSMSMKIHIDSALRIRYVVLFLLGFF